MPEKRAPKRLTTLQEKILYWFLDHPDVRHPTMVCSRTLQCSYSTVDKAQDNPLFKARLKEIKDMVDQSKVMQRQERLETLTAIARASIVDLVSADGKVLEVDRSNPAHRAVQDFEITTTSIGSHKKDNQDLILETRRKVKMYSKIAAIELISKIEGDFNEHDDTGRGGNTVTNFVFILPDGTQVSPAALREVKLLADNSKPG